MTSEERAVKSANILRVLNNLDELSQARTIMGFAALVDEVDLAPLWQHIIASGRVLAFPAMTGEDGRMDAKPVGDLERDLEPGRFGILQPVASVPLDPREIDFVFVPALVYDLRGHRLGRGGGYYDRFLAGRAPQAFRCGVGFECQVLPEVPIKDHDCPVQALVTEKGVRRTSQDQNCLSDVV